MSYFEDDQTPEQAKASNEVLMQSGSKNRNESLAAVHELAKALETPLRS